MVYYKLIMFTEHRSKERIRKFRQDRYLSSDDDYQATTVTLSPDMFYFIHNGQHLSDLLEQRLAELGETRPWIIDRSRIFQYAIINLARAIDKTPMPDYIKNGGLVELMELTHGLTKLFSQQVHRQIVIEHNNSTTVDAYYQDSHGQEKRLHLFTKNKDVMSQKFNRLVGANTQITIKDILSRNGRGKAIAGSDSELRCGLRFRGPANQFRWSVTIDSGSHQYDGEPFSKGYDPRTWKVIRPLSQAINQLKLNPEISGLDSDDPSLYSYHYKDLISLDADQSFSHQTFKEFNQHLSQIFINLPR